MHWNLSDATKQDRFLGSHSNSRCNFTYLLFIQLGELVEIVERMDLSFEVS